MRRDIIVIGGGAGGLAAALSAKEDKKDVLLIEREDRLGGILNQCIHNGFGLEVFKEEYTGPEYAEIYINKFHDAHIDFLLNTTVISLEKVEDEFILYTSSLAEGIQKYTAKAVVITTGCYERTRGSIIIPGDRPKGVITAGSAQRYLNIDGYMIGKKVFILGSGDIGLIMARRMYLEGAEVLGVAELMPYSNGLTRNIVQCLNDYDIPLFLSHTVTEIKADAENRLSQITIQQVDDHFQPIPGSKKRFDVDTLLLSIGLIPDIVLLDSLPVEYDPLTKSVKINQSCETTIPGLFIAGNSLQVHDLVDNVSKESERAGHHAAEYVSRKKTDGRTIKVLPGENVSYVSPQYIDFSWGNSEIICSLRSKQKIEKAALNVIQDGKTIVRKRLMYVVPAEMETFRLDIEDLDADSDILVSLEVLS
ncbi:MAG: FAD-dependent oxidoreductase [Bacilli bacterium]|nr:FAD-dependent oxidoreductase [Bacilli bacterium]MBN2876575.1 FAD-dependent oxidoreductase [Bacilli bacterium]